MLPVRLHQAFTYYLQGFSVGVAMRKANFLASEMGLSNAETNKAGEGATVEEEVNCLVEEADREDTESG